MKLVRRRNGAAEVVEAGAAVAAEEAAIAVIAEAAVVAAADAGRLLVLFASPWMHPFAEVCLATQRGRRLVIWYEIPPSDCIAATRPSM
jgi:hypothetical protein